MRLILLLALRNLFRNRTRTVINLGMVVGAFTSVIFFKGFSNCMLFNLETSFTKGQSGHIQIAKKVVWDGDSVKPKEDAYIESHQALADEIGKLPEVAQASGRVFAYVLLSVGDKSIGATVIGFDPEKEKAFQEVMLINPGSPMTGEQSFAALLGSGLQKQMQMEVGGTFSIISQTLSGSMSSIEPEVVGISTTGLADIDDVTLYMPLRAVQKLLDTDRVERLFILLKDGSTIKAVSEKIRTMLVATPGLIAKEWTETAVFVNQVREFYKLQNLMVELILTVLVFFGILNTVGMSIFERIGEIGTMRAIGDQRAGVLTLFLTEALILGLVGAAIGIPVAYLTSLAFTAVELEVLLPGASMAIPVEILPAAKDFLGSAVMVNITCLLSSLWPAIKAIRLPIVDALRANS